MRFRGYAVWVKWFRAVISTIRKQVWHNRLCAECGRWFGPGDELLTTCTMHEGEPSCPLVEEGLDDEEVP